MTQMTSRERLQAALHTKEVDQLPWSPVMDGYFTSSLPKQGYHFDLLEAARYIGCDFMERHVANPAEKYTNVELRIEDTATGFRTYYETPVGTG